MKNNIQKYSLKAALQAGAAYDFAVLKSRRQWKREKSDKKAYVPGSIGLSAVSQAIKNSYGDIHLRKARKYIAEFNGKPFTQFYGNSQ